MTVKTEELSQQLKIGEHYLLAGERKVVYVGYDKRFEEHEFAILSTRESEGVRVIRITEIGKRMIEIDGINVSDKGKAYVKFIRLLKIIKGGENDRE